MLLEGNFENGQLNGFGRIIAKDGEYYVGSFDDNKCQIGVLRHIDGSAQVGFFRKDVFHVP